MKTSNLVKTEYNKVVNTLASNQFISVVYSVTSALLYAFTRIMGFARSVGNLLMAPVNLIINWCYNLLNILLDIVTLGAAEGYLGERFADGFAASYGFGEALTSALGKFNGNGISYDNIIDVNNEENIPQILLIESILNRYLRGEEITKEEYEKIIETIQYGFIYNGRHIAGV